MKYLYFAQVMDLRTWPPQYRCEACFQIDKDTFDDLILHGEEFLVDKYLRDES